MRLVEIDGRCHVVDCCEECPFVFDDGHVPVCNHPGVRPPTVTDEKGFLDECPLREVPEWAHLRPRITEAEALGCLLEFCMPMLLEDIAKRDPETKERMVRNLKEIVSIAQMKPEEMPLCTMDQEDAIKRGIEACTVKGDKE